MNLRDRLGAHLLRACQTVTSSVPGHSFGPLHRLMGHNANLGHQNQLPDKNTVRSCNTAPSHPRGFPSDPHQVSGKNRTQSMGETSKAVSNFQTQSVPMKIRQSISRGSSRVSTIRSKVSCGIGETESCKIETMFYSEDSDRTHSKDLGEHSPEDGSHRGDNESHYSECSSAYDLNEPSIGRRFRTPCITPGFIQFFCRKVQNVAPPCS